MSFTMISFPRSQSYSGNRYNQKTRTVSGTGSRTGYRSRSITTTYPYLPLGRVVGLARRKGKRNGQPSGGNPYSIRKFQGIPVSP